MTIDKKTLAIKYHLIVSAETDKEGYEKCKEKGILKKAHIAVNIVAEGTDNLPGEMDVVEGSDY